MTAAETKKTKKHIAHKPSKTAKVNHAVKHVSERIHEDKQPVVHHQPKIVKMSSTNHYAVGRRKSSVARVYYFVSPNFEIFINNKTFKEYFPHQTDQQTVERPLNISSWAKGKWVVNVRGGGIHGQAASISLGIARILQSMDVTLRSPLKSEGLLTRDARVKERKKYGLKRARRAPQWQKR